MIRYGGAEKWSSLLKNAKLLLIHVLFFFLLNQSKRINFGTINKFFGKCSFLCILTTKFKRSFNIIDIIIEIISQSIITSLSTPLIIY